MEEAGGSYEKEVRSGQVGKTHFPFDQPVALTTRHRRLTLAS
jgi:hypothetical protein